MKSDENEIIIRWRGTDFEMFYDGVLPIDRVINILGQAVTVMAANEGVLHKANEENMEEWLAERNN